MDITKSLKKIDLSIELENYEKTYDYTKQEDILDIIANLENSYNKVKLARYLLDLCDKNEIDIDIIRYINRNYKIDILKVLIECKLINLHENYDEYLKIIEISTSYCLSVSKHGGYNCVYMSPTNFIDLIKKSSHFEKFITEYGHEKMNYYETRPCYEKKPEIIKIFKSFITMLNKFKKYDIIIEMRKIMYRHNLLLFFPHINIKKKNFMYVTSNKDIINNALSWYYVF